MKSSKITVIIITLSLLYSCRSSKDLIYLKDASPEKVIQVQVNEYRLKPGDILYVSIKSINPEVNSLFDPESGMDGGQSYSGYGYTKFTTPSSAYLYGFEVDNSGKIKIPILGEIKVSGLSLGQSEVEIQHKADEYLKEAIIKVKLLNFKITVSGEVRNPGIYYNYNNSITIIEALAMANGNTDFASIKDIMVIRRFPEGDKSYLLDLRSKKIYLSDAFYLQPNDYIFVQPDKYKNFQLNSQAYSLVFSSVSILLAVLGFVTRP
jgi:polysaccharide export outer membrane protein